MLRVPQAGKTLAPEEEVPACTMVPDHAAGDNHHTITGLDLLKKLVIG